MQQVRTLHRHGQADRQVRGSGVGAGHQFSPAGGTIWSASWSTLFNRNYLSQLQDTEKIVYKNIVYIYYLYGKYPNIEYDIIILEFHFLPKK